MIEDLIKKNEGATLEFKENIKSASLIPTIIAFANTSGGRIIIGINDKTRYITGIQDPHQNSENIINQIHDAIEPKILPNIEVIPYRNTYVISIEIYPSPLKPHYIKSKGKEKSTYIRIGSTTRLADDALLSVIERSKKIKSYDEELYYAANCEDIDFASVSQFFAHQKTLLKNDFISLGILSKEGKELIPTTAGILLFGKNRLELFPDAYIQIGVFGDTTRDKILNSQKITSFFPQAIEEALSFIKRHVRVELKIEDIRHQEFWEIPKIALREAIINAVVHTDYSLKGSPIRLAIFDDRIEIENSALLLSGLTFEDLKNGISKIRNPIIARIFNELGLIEQWGSGINRMINICKEAGLKEPKFEELNSRIRVTFYKEKITQPTLDSVDKKIVKLLGSYGPLSTHQFSECLNISRRSIINRLARLRSNGQIIEIAQTPNDPKKQYSLKEEKKAISENYFDETLHSIKQTFQNPDSVKAFWQDINYQRYAIFQIKVDKDWINLCFSKVIVDDFFFNDSSKHEIKALSKVQKIVTSDPIFREILLNALANETTQKSFKKRETTTYYVQPEDFLDKDYRDPSNGYR